jgi:hypothetical protein
LDCPLPKGVGSFFIFYLEVCKIVRIFAKTIKYLTTMPNLERRKIEISCGETEVCFYSNVELDELRAIMKRFEDEQGATHCSFYEKTDRCGDHESYHMEFCKYREETDDEYNKRIREETDREQQRAQEQKQQDFKNLKTELERMEKELATTPESIKKMNEELANLPNRIAAAKQRLQTEFKYYGK